MTWRVGTKLGRTLYRDEVLVGMVDTPEIAAEIVAAVYAVDEGRKFWDHVDSGQPAIEREKETAARLAAANAEVERLRVELKGAHHWEQQYTRENTELKADLATAHALLEMCDGEVDSTDVQTALTDYFAAQPAAAPSVIQWRCPMCPNPHAASERCQDYAPTPTEDTKRREPGCECHLDEGDSPCVVHGLYEAETPTPVQAEGGPDLYDPRTRTVLAHPAQKLAVQAFARERTEAEPCWVCGRLGCTDIRGEHS